MPTNPRKDGTPELPPLKPGQKQHSGAQKRLFYRAKADAEHEALIALMKAQGRYVQLDPNRPEIWRPRGHQKLLEEAWKEGKRRQAHVWHRRAGKTAACLDFLARRAMERPGNYWFLTPKLTQTRTAIWDSRRSDGLREIDVHFPAAIRQGVNVNQMLIELKNDSAIKFLGSDGFDKLVGSNVHGIVFDEFALGDPAAWDYLSPILLADPAKLAWAIFISTFRGRNHWYRLYSRVKDDPDWTTSLKTIDDTFREGGGPIVTKDDLARERKQGKLEEYLRQEYYCDPYASFEGAFYATALRAMQTEGRIGPTAYDPVLPVVASVDLGYADELVFTFWQNAGGEHRCIGSKSWKFTSLSDALDDIKTTFPWGKRPMTAVIPHDGRFGAAQVFEPYGYDPIVLPMPLSLPPEIERVRGFLGRVRIDNAVRPWTDNEENNVRLVEALQGYRTIRSRGDAETYQRAAAHTWESHWADSLRYYTVFSSQYDPAVTWTRPPDYSQQDRAQQGIATRYAG